MPAKKVILQGFMGLVLFMSVRSYKGLICRQCGIAMGRELNARTLTYGWWSIMAPIYVPLGLLANVVRMRGLSRLAEPHGAVSAPLPIGRSAWERPGAVVATAIMAPVSIMLIVLIVVAFASG